MARVLIAGIGNVFLGDDGFGVEVARRLRAVSLPPEVEVVDVGIRGLHLAFQLLDGYDLMIAVDAVSCGGPPGTLYVLEPELAEAAGRADAHSVDLASVLTIARSMGGPPTRVMVVGCEPLTVDEGMELSPAVRAAIEPAVARVREIAEGAHHEAEARQS